MQVNSIKKNCCLQVSTYSKAIDTPFSSVRKSDVRVSNPGVAIAPAYTRFASPLVSHVGVAAPVAKVSWFTNTVRLILRPN